MGKNVEKRSKGRASPQKKQSSKSSQEMEAVNEEHKRILQWLQTVKFRKTFLNGVDERDLWKKLEELNGLYEASLVAERARYDTLLRAFDRSKKAELEKYKKALRILQTKNEALQKANSDAAISSEVE